MNTFTTPSNGSLGSRNDEERSEVRYVLWHVFLVNHSNLERNAPDAILIYQTGTLHWEISADRE